MSIEIKQENLVVPEVGVGSTSPVEVPTESIQPNPQIPSISSSKAQESIPNNSDNLLGTGLDEAQVTPLTPTFFGAKEGGAWNSLIQTKKEGGEIGIL